MTAPIIARIAITQDEMRTVRKLAIDRAVPTSQLLAEIVRKHLGLKAAK